MYQEPPAAGDVAALHAGLYAGAIYRFRALPEMAALVAAARGFVEERLHPHHPPEIHRHHDPVALPVLLEGVQRDFSRWHEAKRLWRALFEAIGLDPASTARDRLVVRFQIHSDPDAPPAWARSTATVGFHRDSWGTNLPAQVNWWAPVWPITAGRTFAIHPGLWDQPIPNNSRDFDMAAIMAKLRDAPGTVERGEMAPGPTIAIDSAGGVPVLLDPGEIIAFSAQHAHVGVPNHTGLTRISLETRTLSIDDHRTGRGAPNVDGKAKWQTPGLFRRLSDGMLLHDILGCERLEAMP